MCRVKTNISTMLILGIGVLASACAELNPKFEESLNNALDAQKSEFETCYEKALEKNQNATGEMNLKLEFTPNNKRVEKANVTKSDISDKEMKKCVTRAAKSIETTELPGTWVTGKYTLDFTVNK
jgi:hypothetical protein